ncbi:uncharacterized protein TRUGW13939_10487 [Talaromyces rugulosus]|uniref:Uncharacterized protein n=1 Tax=Talaromyces rugulosus TaxID=121627 RepID=A0A7H8RB30_TALRU|nr:uncharacterized protein TRUGW13939_10487 [Talaromyces rugulosus]QKX63317.1 hypothetical protein TRUGW13939_10487 [Talaromyces rugulosus]
MYPWHERLNAWANGTGIHIDALGLVTLLGAEDMDRIVGRLIPSPYLDYLPLLGAFTVSASHFTRKQSGFILYSISDGMMTTELAGWFSRWLQTQEFDRVRSIVTWQAGRQPPQLQRFFLGFLLIALPIHGMLIALTVLAADWWGLANVVSMIASVVVRCVLVSEIQAGIDRSIRKSEEAAQKYNYPLKRAKYDEAKTKLENIRQMGQPTEGMKEPIAPKDQYEIVKIIVVTDESKAVTIQAPRYLTKSVFAVSPEAPNPNTYRVFQAIGWVAFAVHVISIGMAQLYTQIASVVLILGATILTAYKIGCEDSRPWQFIRRAIHEEDQGYSCRLTSNLKATVSTYPADYCEWQETAEACDSFTAQEMDKNNAGLSRDSKRVTVNDVEKSQSPTRPTTPGRQDLYAWLDLTEAEDKCLNIWGLIPHDPEWVDRYLEKKMFHRRRMERKNILETES